MLLLLQESDGEETPCHDDLAKMRPKTKTVAQCKTQDHGAGSDHQRHPSWWAMVAKPMLQLVTVLHRLSRSWIFPRTSSSSSEHDGVPVHVRERDEHTACEDVRGSHSGLAHQRQVADEDGGSVHLGDRVSCVSIIPMMNASMEEMFSGRTSMSHLAPTSTKG